MATMADFGVEISFDCTACGRCCNSPPRLSLPELFRFQEVFVGCLSISRLAAGKAADHAALLDRLAIRAPGPAGATHVAILPQAYGYEADAQCPALAAGGACTLHARGKPAQCDAVPLDPFAPDTLQTLVLRERMAETAFADAHCMAVGSAKRLVLTRDRTVVSADFAGALAARRQAVADDANFWGRRVFTLLQTRRFPDMPLGAYVALPMTLALLCVAGISNACRLRCLGFIGAQLQLLDRSVQRAKRLRRSQDRPTTRRLLAWAEEYRGLQQTLAEPPASWLAAEQARAGEAWLEPAILPNAPGSPTFQHPQAAMN